MHHPVETWASLARSLGVHDLIAVAEFIVTPPGRNRPPLATIDELEHFVLASSGMTGISKLRSAVARTRVGARSRPETFLRLLCDESGMPEPSVNAAYRLSSGRTAIPDLSWPDYRVAAEYDGAYHDRPGQWEDDVVRTEELVDDGWTVVHVLKHELFGQPFTVVGRLNQRLSSRGAPTRSVTRFTKFEP